MPLIFRGDFESGFITTPADAGQGTGYPIENTFFYSGHGPNGEVRGNDPRPENRSRVVAGGPRLAGSNYSFRQAIFYGDNFRPFNAHPDTEDGLGLQKPRAALLMNHPDCLMVPGQEYVIAFAFYLPPDFILENNTGNEESFVQFLRSAGGKPKHLLSMGLKGNQIHVEVDYRGGTAGGTWSDTITAVPGTWYRFVIHTRLAKTAGQNGFFRIYRDGDSVTRFYDHTGINTNDDSHKFAVNLYKYSWWANRSEPSYVSPWGGQDKEPFPDVRGAWTWLQSNKPNATNDTGERVIWWDHLMIWKDDDFASFDDVTPTWSGGTNVNALITGINGGNGIAPNATQIRLTDENVDLRGAYRLVLEDSAGNTEDALVFSGTDIGGRFKVGALTNLLGGLATVTVHYKPALYDSDIVGDLTGWALFNLVDDNGDVPAYDNGGDFLSTFGLAGGVVLQNSTNARGLANIKSANQPTYGVGELATIRLTAKEGTTDEIQFRVQSPSGDDVTVLGGMGGLSSFNATEHGTGHTVNVETEGTTHFITIEFTTTEAGKYLIKTGPGTAVINDTIIVLRGQMWQDKTSGASTLSGSTSIVKPNTTAPSVLEFDIEKSGVRASLFGAADRIGVTDYVLVTDGATAPDQDDLQNGTAPAGSTLLWASSKPASSTDITFLSPTLPTDTDWVAYVMRVDADGNRSAVYQSESTVDAVITAAKEIRFRTSNDTHIERGGAPYTGTADAVKLYASDPRETNQDPLVEWGATTITSGELTLSDSGVVLGSLSAQSTGVDYHINIYKRTLDGANALNVYGTCQLTEV